jgi:uncharacterized membrane protein YjjB (DUF3815 family)
MCWIGLGENLSYIMSGAIMIIIPGLAIGTSIRDIMSNDILSGSVRLFQAIVSAMAIAAGFGVFAQIYDKELLMSSNENYIMILVGAFVSTFGFAIILNNKYKQLPIVAIGGVLSTVVYLVANHLTNGDSFVSVMAGTMFATIMAEILARILKSPTTVFLIPTIIPFVPGAKLFFMMYSLINGDMDKLSTNFNGLGLASLGIAVGIILASVFFQVVFKLINKLKPKKIVQ